jgi:hypothetical protein
MSDDYDDCGEVLPRLRLLTREVSDLAGTTLWTHDSMRLALWIALFVSILFTIVDGCLTRTLMSRYMSELRDMQPSVKVQTSEKD